MRSLLLLLVSVATAQRCYWPSGDLAPSKYTTCNAAAKVSTCCDQDSVCLDNGFCMSAKSFGNRLLRQACTDKNWGAGCAQGCKDTFPGGQASLLLMGDHDPGTYCCGNINLVAGNCQFTSGGSREPFRGPANGAVIWDRNTGSTDLSALLSNATASETSTVTVSTSGTATGISIPVNTACSGSDTKQISCPKNNEVAIGAGVGAGMAAALAVVGALLFWQMRKRKDAERRLEEMMISPPPQHYDVGYGGAGGTGYMPVESKTTYRSELPGNYEGTEMRA